MAVQLQDSPSAIRTGSGRRPAKGLAASLSALRLPRCPDCGKRGMLCRYTVPASYSEPAPRYFECDHCCARYFRMVSGPWFSAAGRQFSHCYDRDSSQTE